MAASNPGERAHPSLNAGGMVDIPVDDLIEEALSGAGPALRGHRISVHIAPTLPLATVDPAVAVAEIGRALKDAVEAAPPGADLSIGASRWNDGIDVRVATPGGAAHVVNFPEAAIR